MINYLPTVEYSKISNKLYFTFSESSIDDFISDLEYLQKNIDHCFYVEGAELTSTLYHPNTTLIIAMDIFREEILPEEKFILFKYNDLVVDGFQNSAIYGYLNLNGINFFLEKLLTLKNKKQDSITIELSGESILSSQNEDLKRPEMLSINMLQITFIK